MKAATDKRKYNGGARPGTGPKLKYGEPTEKLFFNVPVSKKNEIKDKVKKILQKLEVKSK